MCFWSKYNQWRERPSRGGWVGRLKTYLELDDEKIKFRVYNLGVSGDTTVDLLERIEVEAKARSPYVIIFSIGNNDSSFRKTLNREKTEFDIFKENIKRLNKISRKFTQNVIFTGLTSVDERKTRPVSWSDNAFYENKSVKKYNDAIEDFCKESNVPFVPMFDLLANEDLADGLHPNAEGHKKIFERVKGFLEKERFLDNMK